MAPGRPTADGYARLHALVVRFRAVRDNLGVDLNTAGRIVRAADASGGNVEAACRALDPKYDRLGGMARAILATRVGEALTAAERAS